MNKQLIFIYSFLLVFCTVLTLVTPVNAQTTNYSVHLNRDFGYGGGVNIRGTFTISLVGDTAQVQEVTFLIDGKAMTTIRTAPFKFQFHTDDYGFGMHSLWAEYNLQDGSAGKTEAVEYHFVSPEAERKQVSTILGGIGGAILVTLLIVALAQGLWLKRSRKHLHQPGEPRHYGVLGGTVCPNCGRPFPRHWWGINLLVGRLDRCDNCGKWVMTHRATPAELAAAEAKEEQEIKADQKAPDTKQNRKDDLENSRYVDEI
jgi:ribosomal protein L32